MTYPLVHGIDITARCEDDGSHAGCSGDRFHKCDFLSYIVRRAINAPWSAALFL